MYVKWLDAFGVPVIFYLFQVWDGDLQGMAKKRVV